MKKIWPITVFLFIQTIDKNPYANTLLTISGSTPHGYYSLAAKAMAYLFNEDQKKYTLAVLPSKGSVQNIEKITSGKTDLAIIQSDVLQSYYDRQPNDAKKKETIRPLLKMGKEFVAFVAASSSGINSIVGMRRKNINIGPKGSSHQVNAIDVLNALYPDWRKNNYISERPIAEALKDISDFKLDATFVTMFHPNPITEQAVARKRKLKFIPIVLDEANKYFQRTVLEKDIYPNLDNWRDIPMIATHALLVAREDIDSEFIRFFFRSLKNNYSELQKIFPPLKTLTWKQLQIETRADSL